MEVGISVATVRPTELCCQPQIAGIVGNTVIQVKPSRVENVDAVTTEIRSPQDQKLQLPLLNNLLPVNIGLLLHTPGNLLQTDTFLACKINTLATIPTSVMFLQEI